MTIGQRIPQVEKLARERRVEIAIEFGMFVHARRLAGETYQEIAERENVHPSTIRRYIKWLEGYGLWDGLASKSNALALACVVCAEPFVSARADKRYCSSACRQDAYRRRRSGASPAGAGG